MCLNSCQTHSVILANSSKCWHTSRSFPHTHQWVLQHCPAQSSHFPGSGAQHWELQSGRGFSLSFHMRPVMSQHVLWPSIAQPTLWFGSLSFLLHQWAAGDATQIRPALPHGWMPWADPDTSSGFPPLNHCMSALLHLPENAVACSWKPLKTLLTCQTCRFSNPHSNTWPEPFPKKSAVPTPQQHMPGVPAQHPSPSPHHHLHHHGIGNYASTLTSLTQNGH